MEDRTSIRTFWVVSVLLLWLKSTVIDAASEPPDLLHSICDHSFYTSNSNVRVQNLPTISPATKKTSNGTVWVQNTPTIVPATKKTSNGTVLDQNPPTIVPATNKTSNSTYGINLNSILDDMTSNKTATIGFYNSSAGQEPRNRVYALAMCRGDNLGLNCMKCLKNSVIKLPEACPGRRSAIGWYDTCMLYYQNESMIGKMDDRLAFKLCNPSGVSHNTDQFSQALGSLMEGLRKKAASGNSTLKYAAGETNITGFKEKLYGLLQCTPDLNETSCGICLGTLIDYIQTEDCVSKKGARIFAFSCIMRYEMYEFVENGTRSSTPEPTTSSPPPDSSSRGTRSSTPEPTTSSPPPDSSSRGKKSSSKNLPVIVAVPIIVAVFLLVSAICLIACRRRRLKHASYEDDSLIDSAESLHFDLSQIRNATHNFSEDNKLGQGGFGAVYKGRLENGQEIAVKRLSSNSGQGITEFKTEVVLVAKLQHRNLVKLLGFCASGKEKILVYEYLRNSSLDRFLFGTSGEAAKSACLNWKTRFKIICGIAKGLLYLHEDSRLKIIHRDLKSSNILLDNEMNPKIADFGLARLLGVDQTQDNTNRIVGTYGYMAPGYALTGRFSTKSDVYSFGIIVLEIVSGQKNRFFDRPEAEEPLIFRAWKQWEEKCAFQLVDSSLGKDYSREEVMRCIHISLLCIQEGASRRPIMASVVPSLHGQSISLPIPAPPSFFSHSTMISDMTDSRNTQETTAAHMPGESSICTTVSSITEFYPR